MLLSFYNWLESPAFQSRVNSNCCHILSVFVHAELIWWRVSESRWVYGRVLNHPFLNLQQSERQSYLVDASIHFLWWRYSEEQSIISFGSEKCVIIVKCVNCLSFLIFLLKSSTFLFYPLFVRSFFHPFFCIM